MRIRMKTSVIVAGMAILLAGCGDPLSEVPRYSDVPVTETAGQADALPGSTAPAPSPEAAPRRGLLGLLGRRAETAKAEPAPAAESQGVGGPAVPVAAASAPKRDAAPRGLFGGLFSAGGGSSADRAATSAARAPRAGAPDAREVPMGTTLPYGEIARVCDVPARQLGKKVEDYPERGGQYAIHDSAPGSTGAHAFYLTGFGDGCARQFTAAMAIFGSPESYEDIHYGPSGEKQPVSETDRAYEKIKSRVCNVRRGKPCGSRMRRLARDTVFVSVYERFGSNPRWKNILLHDGEVIAMDIKD